MLPRPDDQLWIVMDGAVEKPGVGAILYVTQSNKLHVAGCFSAKFRGCQVSWLLCEEEALAIAVATKHFSPHITQANSKTSILADSKPCVQAFEKLCRGEFSASPRVSTFLSTACRYQASDRHMVGSAILSTAFLLVAKLQTAKTESVKCAIYTGSTDWCCKTPVHRQSCLVGNSVRVC